MSLKKETQGELNLAIGNTCVGDSSGLTRVDRDVWLSEVSGVGQVEKLRAKLQTVTLSKGEDSIHKEIEVNQPRYSNDIPRRVAEGIGERDGKAGDLVPRIDGSLTGIEVVLLGHAGMNDNGGIDTGGEALGVLRTPHRVCAYRSMTLTTGS